MMVRLSIVFSARMSLLLCIVAWMGHCTSVRSQTRPNFLIIITDDQRYDTVGSFMPNTQTRIFNQGVTFRNGYGTTPFCCPSRASLLTGMCAHDTGVRTNQDILPESTLTFMERLHTNNYFTGIVGKYLNSWDGTPRPEYDFWVSFRHQGSYTDPRLNVNGVWIDHNHVDALSLVQLIQRPSGWRTDLLIEGWPINEGMPFTAVHTERYVYVETPGDLSELYDLRSDPYQLENRIDDPSYEQVVTRLRRRLRQLRSR